MRMLERATKCCEYWRKGRRIQSEFIEGQSDQHGVAKTGAMRVRDVNQGLADRLSARLVPLKQDFVRALWVQAEGGQDLHIRCL